ncbi:hypothetical protein FQN57_003232 [Myotisia sp. PD_48]|nr:hypothetical protein FQN57_003232 [Myotisia sp. PD_48]
MARHAEDDLSSSLAIELPASRATDTALEAKLNTCSTPYGDSLSHEQPGTNHGVSSALEAGIRSPSPSSTSIHFSESTSLPKWNDPPINRWRFGAANFSFIILGMNDAAYGALIPYLETYYDISYTVVSLVFLSPLLGYVTSAILNNMIHMKFGQRGVAILGPSAHLIAYIIVCLHPPYPVLVVAFIVAGFGNGISDAAWNAWLGGMANANELLGFLHAFYGLGGTLAPTIATSLITKANWKWFQFYYLVVGAACLELIFLTTTFWNATGAKYREENRPSGTNFEGSNNSRDNNGARNNERLSKKMDQVIRRMFGNSRTAEALRNKVTWICSAFLAIYVGAEVGLGGWIVTFMIRIRHGSPFASGMTSTGFWLGITVGRVILGFVTPRLFKTEKHAVAVYLLCCVGLELLFWLIPQFYISAVMVSFLGFFLGPLFPAGIVAATKLLPKHLHVSAIGFAAAMGASGATALPFAIGAIAQAKGVSVLQPFTLALLVVCLGIWMCLPSLSKKTQ